MNRQELVKKAREFCWKNNIDSYPVDIVTLCNQLGFRVFEEYLPPAVSGFVIVQRERLEKYGCSQVIVINLSDSPRQRRFTIAHELAHYLLHRREGEALYAHRETRLVNCMEREADLFAAGILMPEQLVREALRQWNAQERGAAPLYLQVRYIADAFAVTESAAQNWLAQLKSR